MKKDVEKKFWLKHITIIMVFVSAWDFFEIQFSLGMRKKISFKELNTLSVIQITFSIFFFKDIANLCNNIIICIISFNINEIHIIHLGEKSGLISELYGKIIHCNHHNKS